MYWIDLAQDSDKSFALMNTAMTRKWGVFVDELGNY